MKCVIDSGNVIKRIREGKDLEEIATYARNQIFPVSYTHLTLPTNSRV